MDEPIAVSYELCYPGKVIKLTLRKDAVGRSPTNQNLISERVGPISFSREHLSKHLKVSHAEDLLLYLADEGVGHNLAPVPLLRQAGVLFLPPST